MKIFSKNLPPQDFFKQVKDKRQVITKEMLDALQESLKSEVQAFLDNGQQDSAERLLFHTKNVEREQAVISAGFTTFIYRDDLDVYITSVAKSVVKITDIASFERKIPDEQSQLIRKAKPLFDEIYIVFTDYTGKEERKVKNKDRARDPIALGVFKSKDNKVWNHRFYYICDWTDDYCDLTLDKYVTEMISADHLEPVKTADNITIAELEQRVKAVRAGITDDQKPRFITTVRLRDDVAWTETST